MKRVRICVAGNSYLAAWKHAWDNWPESERMPYELTFFGSSGQTLAQLKREGDALIPTASELAECFALTSGGKREIVLSDYDAIVLVGIVIHFRDWLAIFKRHAVTGWHRYRNVKFVISEGVYREVVDAYKRERAYATIAPLLESSGKSVIVVPPPLPSNEILQDKAFRDYDVEYINDLYSRYRQELANDVVRFGHHVMFQGPETQEPVGLTRAEFSKNGIGLSSASTRTAVDLIHMNGAFGKIQVVQALELVQRLS